MIRIRCHCGKSVKLPTKHLGKAASCPQCHGRVRIVAGANFNDSSRLKGAFIIRTGPRNEGEQVFLGGSEPIVVGKAEDANLRLLASSVSRKHCRLISNDRGWRIEDNGSTNGLFVNGRQVKGHNLIHGDSVRVGDFELQYSYEPGKRGTSVLEEELASPSSTAVSEEEAASVLGLHFLDDTASMEAMAAASASGKSAVKETSGASNSGGDEEAELFQFAPDHDLSAGPPISLPVPNATTRPPTEIPKVVTCPNCNRTVPPGAALCVSCGTYLKTGQRVEIGAGEQSDSAVGSVAMGGSIGAYLKDCLWSFTVILALGNLVKFIILAMAAMLLGVMVVLPMGGLMLLAFRFLGIITIAGWIFSYLFNVVCAAAGGDEDLPPLSMGDGIWDDGVVPFFKFLGMLALIHIPAIAYAFAMQLTWTQVIDGTDPVFEALLWARALMWPFAMLITAMGGLECFLRPDLILKTIARSFLPYLAACGMTALALGVVDLAASLAAGNTPLFNSSPWAGISIVIVLSVGCWIVAMRCIGLYYHHFKSRFAWSWG